MCQFVSADCPVLPSTALPSPAPAPCPWLTHSWSWPGVHSSPIPDSKVWGSVLAVYVGPSVTTTLTTTSSPVNWDISCCGQAAAGSCPCPRLCPARQSDPATVSQARFSQVINVCEIRQNGWMCIILRCGRGVAGPGQFIKAAQWLRYISSLYLAGHLPPHIQRPGSSTRHHNLSCISHSFPPYSINHQIVTTFKCIMCMLGGSWCYKWSVWWRCLGYTDTRLHSATVPCTLNITLYCPNSEVIFWQILSE